MQEAAIQLQTLNKIALIQSFIGRFVKKK